MIKKTIVNVQALWIVQASLIDNNLQAKSPSSRFDKQFKVVKSV